MVARPVRLQLDKPAQSLVIEWSDGVRHRFPWNYLRAHCPSANEKASRDEAARNPLSVLRSVPSTELVSIRQVGHYALGLTWSDGHSAGIYTWEYLQQLANDPHVLREEAGAAGS